MNSESDRTAKPQPRSNHGKVPPCHVPPGTGFRLPGHRAIQRLRALESQVPLASALPSSADSLQCWNLLGLSDRIINQCDSNARRRCKNERFAGFKLKFGNHPEKNFVPVPEEPNGTRSDNLVKVLKPTWGAKQKDESNVAWSCRAAGRGPGC